MVQARQGFYIEYNLRLFFFLLIQKTSAICAIDLDTILPCYFVSRIRHIPGSTTPTSCFCEMQEVVSGRLSIRYGKPSNVFAYQKFAIGYTVNDLIATNLPVSTACICRHPQCPDPPTDPKHSDPTRRSFNPTRSHSNSDPEVLISDPEVLISDPKPPPPDAATDITRFPTVTHPSRGPIHPFTRGQSTKAAASNR